MLEIERKFLVTSAAYKELAFAKSRIIQGYLNTNPERAVRVRIKGEQAFITVKGKSNKEGLSRFEWEKEIEKPEALDLIDICEPGIIDKTRYLVRSGDYTFEVDEFYGNNEGLTIAELELTSETEDYPNPKWLGREVTGDVKYYNAQLIKEPYKNWK